jgi:DNA-binding transcriptional LysR family regulator
MDLAGVYDSVTLDQLRAFVVVAEEGSFSAAARKLKRVQSAISTSMANLESHLGVQLWDRSTKIATLTAQGVRMLGSARRVLMEADSLGRLAASMAEGLEPSVSLCFDALFPLEALLDLCTAFRAQFPDVDLGIDTQLMSAVSARVLSGEATLGVVSPGGLVPGLERQVLAAVRMVPVVSPEHALAKGRGPVTRERLAEAIQIVLSERSDVRVPDQAVLSPRTWRVADLHTKHRLLCAGLGWGNLPDHLVVEDLRERRLVVIRPLDWAEDEHTLHLSAVYRRDSALGPAHRWLLDQLPVLCARDLGSRAARPRARAAQKRGPRARVPRQ